MVIKVEKIKNKFKLQPGFEKTFKKLEPTDIQI
jgi:hypothetical protein